MAKIEGPLPLPRPLYDGTTGMRLADPSSSHVGLWYDKFCDKWQASGFQISDSKQHRIEIPSPLTWSQFLQFQVEATGSNDSPKCSVDKPAWIRTVTRQAVGSPELLAEFAQRQLELVKSLGGDCVTLVTESRFATGLGREHPIENGFAWHPALGAPYLAGSGVKGLLRAFIRQWEKDGASRAEEIFGPEDSSCTGKVICFDAMPPHPVRLEADVMTPHYGPYYESTTNEIKPPGDWYSPTPIPYLVVAAGQAFQFAFAPRTTANKALVSQAIAWLRDALYWLGAGAKTAVGYGRFTSDNRKATNPDSETRTALAEPSPPIGLKYVRGSKISVTRIEDPSGRGKIRFQAEDGVLGHFGKSESPPDVSVGESVEVWIANVGADTYMLTTRKPALKQERSSKGERGNRR